MKESTVKVIIAMVLPVGVFTAFVAWYPFVFSLGWPSLTVARMGVPHSWILSAILLLVGVASLGFWSRRRGWIPVVVASLVLPATYCALAFWFVARAAVPLPATTPYDLTPAKRLAYLQAFDSGFRNGSVGLMRSYCFSPEVETRGFYDGAYEGIVVWHRMLGRTISERNKRLFNVSAALDGVRLEPK
jgi:hypothetical protein